MTLVETLLRRAGLATWLGLGGIGLGLSVLLVHTWIEYLRDPSIGLFGGYSIGQEPWISIGVGLALAGSVVAVLSAALIVIVRGDWLRRVLLLPAVGAPVLWWLTALGIIPFPRYLPVDPVALAYTLPESAAIFLVVPAVAAAVLAFLPFGPDLRVRLRPVHPER